MKSIVFKHIMLTFLLGLGAMYAIAYLAFGSDGTGVIAAVSFVGAIVALVIIVERAWADLRSRR